MKLLIAFLLLFLNHQVQCQADITEDYLQPDLMSNDNDNLNFEQSINGNKNDEFTADYDDFLQPSFSHLNDLQFEESDLPKNDFNNNNNEAFFSDIQQSQPQPDQQQQQQIPPDMQMYDTDNNLFLQSSINKNDGPSDLDFNLNRQQEYPNYLESDSLFQTPSMSTIPLVQPNSNFIDFETINDNNHNEIKNNNNKLSKSVIKPVFDLFKQLNSHLDAFELPQQQYQQTQQNTNDFNSYPWTYQPSKTADNDIFKSTTQSNEPLSILSVLTKTTFIETRPTDYSTILKTTIQSLANTTNPIANMTVNHYNNTNTTVLSTKTSPVSFINATLIDTNSTTTQSTAITNPTVNKTEVLRDGLTFKEETETFEDMFDTAVLPNIRNSLMSNKMHFVKKRIHSDDTSNSSQNEKKHALRSSHRQSLHEQYHTDERNGNMQSVNLYLILWIGTTFILITIIVVLVIKFHKGTKKIFE